MTAERSYIAGVKHKPGAKERLNSLEEGAKLILIPEEGNRFDAHAVAIYHQHEGEPGSKMQLGYVPARISKRIKAALHSGRCTGCNMRPGTTTGEGIEIHFQGEADPEGAVA